MLFLDSCDRHFHTQVPGSNPKLRVSSIPVLVSCYPNTVPWRSTFCISIASQTRVIQLTRHRLQQAVSRTPYALPRNQLEKGMCPTFGDVRVVCRTRVVGTEHRKLSRHYPHRFVLRIPNLYYATNGSTSHNPPAR